HLPMEPVHVVLPLLPPGGSSPRYWQGRGGMCSICDDGPHESDLSWVIVRKLVREIISLPESTSATSHPDLAARGRHGRTGKPCWRRTWYRAPSGNAPWHPCGRRPTAGPGRRCSD